MLVRLDLLDGLVDARIERAAHGRDARDPLAPERVGELTLHEREAVGHRLDVARALRALDGALEVVEDGQQRPQQILPAVAPRFLELSTRPLAKVVEVSGRAEQRVLEPQRFGACLGR